MSLPWARPAELAAEGTDTLLVIAKEPVAGRVKTRLQTAFTARQAARLAAASLDDTLGAVLAAPVRRRVLVLDGCPGPWLPDGVEVLPQRGGGLDERLAAAFTDAAPGARGPLLLVGMDTPQLDPDLLTVDWRGVDAVLGLSADGGYWAIGFRSPQPRALLGVPMSTAGTGAAQLDRLRSLGLRVRLLPRLRDVDTPADAAAVAALVPGSRFAAEHRRATRRLVHPLELFEAAMAGEPVTAVGSAGSLRLDTARWNGPADAVDQLVLSRCEGAVLDLGCGPGRLVTALGERGVPALGVDVSASAVATTRRGGGLALRRLAQDPLPCEGRWGTVLLADGNIGIGGDPEALIRRSRALLRPGGLLIVEADPDDGVDDRHPVVLHAADGRRSARLPWSRVGAHALAVLLARHDLGVVEEWRLAGRVLLAARLQ